MLHSITKKNKKNIIESAFFFFGVSFFFNTNPVAYIKVAKKWNRFEKERGPREKGNAEVKERGKGLEIR